MNMDFVHALIGGAIIGVAVSIMLAFNGRVTGIAGIIEGSLKATPGDTSWRLAFLVGLVAGGGTMLILNTPFQITQAQASMGQMILAGLIVGFGTVMGSGCTSGHGVCGISRWSPRSIVATVVFIAAGILTVFVIRKFLGV